LSSLFTVPSKHLFEFFKNVAKTALFSLLLPKLFAETLKTSEPLTKWILTPLKGTLSTKWILLLLVASHTCLVIDSPFVLVT
jgi:hypothetical protein